MVQSGKKCSSLIFWKHGAVNEFYGSIDISSQMRGAEFPVIYGLEKPKSRELVRQQARDMWL